MIIDSYFLKGYGQKKNKPIHQLLKQSFYGYTDSQANRIADYLHSLDIPSHQATRCQSVYKSPLREEAEASFKVNTEREQWYDFGLGKGGGIID